MDNRPIGVYDSGFGGLSVWRELCRRLPNESIIYLGDGKNCPYGGRSREEITSFAVEATERLVMEGVKMVVVGCNTATTAAIATLRSRWEEMPIVGLEPAVKPACMTTQTGRIAVLATEHSLRSDMFLSTTARYADGVEVIKCVGEGFVDIVERGEEGSTEAYEAVRRVVEPLLGTGIDKIVLGCTHYPFLRPYIERVVAGHGIDVIDSGEAVARRVEWLLNRYDIAAGEDNLAKYSFISFADEGYRARLEQRARGILENLSKSTKTDY
ncbi:MAG: glutamate racemase [Alistipes sp.]|nr:glutamate racemase [Alistipes sp.]